MRTSIFAAGLALALLALPALAQAPAAPAGTPMRVRGTIVKLAGNMLTVKPKSGADVTVALAPNFGVSKLVKKKLSDIKTGDFVASTGMKHPDGTIHAVEIRIFPEALRGRGEGQFPWDLSPDSVMTNATVGTITKTTDGAVFHVTFKGGESDYTIGPDTAILGNAPADLAALTPGVAVVAFATKAEDGKIASRVVFVEKDGIKPPM